MILDKVKSILSKQLGASEEGITELTNISVDLGADSLDLVEILMSLEEEFNISIPDEAIPSIKTVGDLVTYINKNIKK
ncbi:MAG: acyl carrier protein [Clostridia bacterium]